MENQYSTRHVIELFSVSHETVKNWTREFADFLSVGATPPAGQRRAFTEDDLRVFAVISEQKKRGLTYADIHASLKAGQRGDVPQPTALDRLPPVVQDMIVRLRDELADLRAQLDAEKAKTNKALGHAEAIERVLKEQLAEKERRIFELIEENARLKTKAE